MGRVGSHDGALAPLFRVRRIQSTKVTLPVELVLGIVHLAVESSPSCARTLALVCRAIYAEVDKQRFRVLRWREPRHWNSIDELITRHGRQFFANNVRALWWDWSHRQISVRELLEVFRCLEWFRDNPTKLKVSVLALNAGVVANFGDIHDGDVLEELMIIYDHSCRGQTINMRLPYRNLTHLLVRNFPVDCWPDALLDCKTLTHVAVSVLHEQDALFAEHAADFIFCLTEDVLDSLPLLQRLLLILMDNGDEPQFANADIYAEALGDACDSDTRVRMDFDTIPCDWHMRWWRSRTQNDGASDFWDRGCSIPQNFRFAKPPLSYFLNLP